MESSDWYTGTFAPMSTAERPLRMYDSQMATHILLYVLYGLEHHRMETVILPRLLTDVFAEGRYSASVLWQ